MCMCNEKSFAGTHCADILKNYPDRRGKDGVYNIVEQKPCTAIRPLTTEVGR